MELLTAANEPDPPSSTHFRVHVLSN